MATATQEPKNKQQPQQTERAVTLAPPRLPYHPAVQERFGLDKSAWKALVEAIFPNATTAESVILALSYCRARNLDPFKRCVHIVPIYSKAQRCMVDTIWPGIGELRTTAFRTGEYSGREETRFGQDVEDEVGGMEITYPEWAQVTVYRTVKGERCAFAGPKVYWIETYATKGRDDDTPNEMWANRPRGQLDKCAEAAALRGAFPEEIGGDCIPEEVQHKTTLAETASPKLSVNSNLERLASRDTPVEPETDEPGELDHFAQYQVDLLKANTVTEANAAYDRWFGPEGALFGSGMDATAVDLRNQHVTQIKSKRGAGSNKQSNLLDTTDTAQNAGE